MIVVIMIIETEFVLWCKQWRYEWSSGLWLLRPSLYRRLNNEVMNDCRDSSLYSGVEIIETEIVPGCEQWRHDWSSRLWKRSLNIRDSSPAWNTDRQRDTNSVSEMDVHLIVTSMGLLIINCFPSQCCITFRVQHRHRRDYRGSNLVED